jgi:hypothetical protein
MKRMPVSISLLMLFTMAFATPVLAAPPSNDTYAGRTVIGTLPFSESLDTTQATTDADDTELNAECGAPSTDASVWYELTPTTDLMVLVDVSSSDYPAGVLVGTGSPGSFAIVSCGPGATAFFAETGVTYAILVIDDQSDGGLNGGTLTISVAEAPPPPTIDVTVDPIGTFNPTAGSATISGTVVCSSDADFAFVDVELRQQVGRFVINGFGSIDVFCDGTAQPWTLEVIGSNGQFKGGRAVAVTFAIACGAFDCGFDFEEQTVMLRR